MTYRRMKHRKQQMSLVKQEILTPPVLALINH